MSHKIMTGPRSVLPRGTACLRCKRYKRKCDAKKPACASCIKAGHDAGCVYHEPPSSRKQTKSQAPQFHLHRLELLQATTDVRVGPEILVMDHSVDWWKLDEVPSPLRDFLILVFLNHTPQVQFEELAPSVISRLSCYPPSHPSYPHPSLMNAMYLIAALYLSSSSHPAHIERRAKWNSAEVERSFLRKTRECMFAETPKEENLVDFVLATGLMTRYFFWTMRISEGHDECLSQMKLAVACNLHRISSPNVEDCPQSRLPPPHNSAEVRLRMNAFWNAFLMDRGRKIGWALDVTVPDEMITTVFPQKPEDLATPQARKSNTVSALVNPAVPHANYDTVYVMKLKLAQFLEVIGRIVLKVARAGATKFAHISNALYTEFCDTEDAYERFCMSVPTELPPVSTTANLLTFESAWADLAKLQTMTQAGIIRLYGPFSLYDERSREKVFAAAKEIVSIARGVAATNEIYWQIPIHFGWIDACVVFQQTISIMLQSEKLSLENEWAILDLRNDMEYLASLTRRFVKVYRFHQPTVQTIENLLAKDSQAIEKLTSGGDRPSTSTAGSSARSQPPLVIEEAFSPSPVTVS